jgi:PadR family transcriptional regulator PadR
MMHIRLVTDELLIVEEGSLYPALHRMEQNGCVRASWAITVRAHARWRGSAGQPRKELGAVSQLRRCDTAFCMK